MSNISMEANFVSAVLYIRNDESVVCSALSTLTSVLDSHFAKFEIICVDDSSIDNCSEIIKEFLKTNARTVTLVKTGFYQGLERSMTAGVDLAIGEFVFEFDTADFVFEPSVIMEAYRRCLQGYDIVSASNGKTSVTSKTFYLWFNKFSRTQYPLMSEDFRIVSRRAINRVHQMSRTVPYRKVMYANCGLKNDNIQYKTSGKVPSRKHETAENTFRQKLAIDSFILYTDVAYKVSFALSVFMLCFSILTGIYAVIVYFVGNPAEGWTPTISFLAVGFSGLFAVLTFIVKYLSVILNLVFEKQKYVIGSIEKL